MTSIERFMALLAAGLNQTEYRIDTLPAVEEWDTLYKYSLQQNLLPIISEQLVFSGVYELAGKTISGKDAKEQKEAFAAIRYRSMFYENMMAFSTDQVQRTVQFYDYYEKIAAAGVRPIVVKGIVCRNTYPKPDLRPSGDEDLYVRPEDYQKVKEVLLENGFRLTDRSADETMLEELEFINPQNGILYEVHTSLMPRISSFYDKHNAAFEGAFERAKIEVFDGYEICTLAETQHLFFLLSHLLKHFVAGGVGIRQLCDILMFIRKYHDVIDWQEFKGWLGKFHLEIFWANLMEIGVRYLAFEPEKYGAPTYTGVKPDQEAILQDMFAAGAFGMSSFARMHSANLTIKAAEDGKAGMTGGLLKALFPSAEKMAERYPYLKEKKYLLPVAYGQRIVKFLKSRSEQSDETGRSVTELGRERVEMLERYGILGK